MKRIIATALLLLASTVADAWCLPGYTEAQDLCHPGLVYCLAAGQTAPTTCGQQQQQQQQNQSQGQGQSQSSNNTNVNNNTSSSHSSSASASSSTSNATGGNSTSNAAGGAGGNSSSNAAGGAGGAGGNGGIGFGGTSANTNTGNNTGNGGGAYVGGDTTNITAARIPVGVASAPVVITGSDQCLIPVSGSVQAAVIGVAVGTAVIDANCQCLKQSDRLKYLGQIDAAVELLAICSDKVRLALDNVAAKVRPVYQTQQIPRPQQPNVYDGRDITAVVPVR